MMKFDHMKNIHRMTSIYVKTVLLFCLSVVRKWAKQGKEGTVQKTDFTKIL